MAHCLLHLVSCAAENIHSANAHKTSAAGVRHDGEGAALFRLCHPHTCMKDISSGTELNLSYAFKLHACMTAR